MENLILQLEELKKKRQNIIQKRNIECDAIRELTFNPCNESNESKNNNDNEQSKTLCFENFTTAEFPPESVVHYTKDIQVDLVEKEEVFVEKPRNKIEIDDSSERVFNLSFSDNTIDESKPVIPSKIDDENMFKYTSDYSIFWSKNQTGRLIPNDVDWSDQWFSVSLKNIGKNNDGFVRLQNLTGLDKEDYVLKLQGQPTTVRFLPHSNDVLVVGSLSGLVFLFDKRVQNTPVAQTQRYNSCHYSQIVSTIFTVQKQFITIAEDGTIFKWDLDSIGSPLAKDSFSNTKSQLIRPTDACLNDNQLYVGFENGTVIQRSLNKDSTIKELHTFDGPITGLSYKQGSKKYQGALAISSLDCSLNIWSNDNIIKTYESNIDSYVDCKWSPSNLPVLAGFRSDSKVIIYDIENSSKETSINVPSIPTCSGFSQDGNILFTGCIDGSYHLIHCPLKKY